MHVALFGTDAVLVETVRGWLADDGHLVRQTDSTQALTDWHEQRPLQAIICCGRLPASLATACAAIEASSSKPLRLIAIDADAASPWRALAEPLRRRVLKATLNSA
ncbi:MAG: hypothetical protein AAF290_08460 [Pseudomonadota bacterium]